MITLFCLIEARSASRSNRDAGGWAVGAVFGVFGDVILSVAIGAIIHGVMK